MPQSNNQHQPGNSVRAPFDPSSTVRLPPPTASGAYAWSGSGIPAARPPLADNTNVLRTPESIIRLHDVATAKRTAADSSSGPLAKRSKLSASGSGLSGKTSSPSTSSFMTDSTNENRQGQWASSFFDRGRFELDRDLERPNTAHPGSYPRLYHQQSPTQIVRENLMPSPSTTPYERKSGSDMNMINTPTRTERPMSNPADLMSYNSGNYLDRRGSGMVMMPPMPSSASSMAAAAAAAMAPQTAQSSLYGSHMSGFEPDLLYSANRHSILPVRNVEIPPPDKMPVIEDDGKKPTYSYAMLIGMAILRAPERKLTLAQIYSWIMDTFEYYRNSKPTWHNSIRHNLSLNKAFEKKVRPKGDPGKGNYWTIVEGLEYQFVRPRPPKRGSEGSASSPLTSSSSLPHDSSGAPTSSSSSAFAPPPTYTYDTLARNNSSSNEAPESAHNHENIPSDGTEPDEGMLEEEKRTPSALYASSHSSSQMGGASHSMNQDSKFGVTDQQVPSSGVELPQMRAMSSSSSRPHSPCVPASSSELPSESQGNGTRLRVDNDNRHQPYSVDNSSEWRGQGQFAFRCSTPSMVPANLGESLMELNPSGRKEQFVQPYMFMKPRSNVQQQSSKKKQSLEDAGETNYSSSLNPKDSVGRMDRSLDVKDEDTKLFKDKNIPGIELQPPKTPEKLPKATQPGSTSQSNLYPNTNSSGGSSLHHGFHTSLTQPRSLESPYAGTLDLSPGIAIAQGIDSIERPRHPHHRHKKQPSLNHLADFLELDFRKADQLSSSSSSHTHRRTGSSSSDENGLSDPTQLSSIAPNSAGGTSHVNSFSMAFDVDVSPRLVMTPIRRPFDTPIRDQAHAYSPYCRGASSSFGSPMRRS